MESPDPSRQSLWHATAPAGEYPPLAGDRETDVIVVGGGITGLTAALMLAESGARVVLVEARELAAGTTGGTTGKVTSQHGMTYADLIERHGEATARAYGQANEAAIRDVEDLCRRHQIDADLEPADAYVYAQNKRETAQLRGEYEAAMKLGLPAEWSDSSDLPFPVTGALRFTGQAQLHAVKYCNGLGRALAAIPNCDVYTGTRATSVRQRGDRVTVETESGRITAQHAVLATLLPITDRGFEFARAKPMRAYGVAAPANGALPDGMYISLGTPSRSIRRYRTPDETYLVVVGQSHEVGHERDTKHNTDALAEFARRHFDVRDIAFRWSAQDYMPDDRMPFIGRTAFSDRIFVATGFRKWGLSNGTVAARIITDLIGGRDNEFADTFSPQRMTVTESARQFLQHNADVAARWVADRVRPQVGSVEDIALGSGATVRIDGRLRAVSRNEDGTLVNRSAVCTHLGCVVQWNTAERSWDCPCHGSRFAAGGAVLDGPATSPLGE